MEKKLKNRIYSALFLLFIAIFSTFVINSKGKNAVSLNVRKKVPIYKVDTKEKKVAMTFDVSLGDEYIDGILDVLDKYDVKATFFIVGEWIDKNEDKMKEIHKRGHEIGNHSNKHPDMANISKEKMINDININEAKIRKVTGEGTKLFRCPSGNYNDLVLDTARELGFYSIQWDVDSIDWKEQGADAEYNRVIKKTKPGSIILFHNTAKYTPDNLKRIIPLLKGEGFKFVKVGDLIYKDNYYIDSAGVQKRN
ncbi:polysaccharide deacetylase family sporulation protein PdaB [Clostridium niameyense]|uniref:polysaccharide deacetylase family sporulation protein PdaB n=1 Tax=Clostridium niameyense TaxID=1622073 RepID=UPI00067F03D7|nr:polysaccharide deacetylase family sporulation protein PdaB [Clostridium niameyense]